MAEIELVIKVSEEVRVAITRMGLLRVPDEMQKEVDRAIQRGKPLPQGHGNLIQQEDAEAIFRDARKALYKQIRKEPIKDFHTREVMLLSAEQLVHLIHPIIEADKESEE